MLKAAIIFFFLGIFAMLLGASGIAGFSVNIGEMVLAVFFIFALFSFMGTAEIERRKNKNLLG